MRIMNSILVAASATAFFISPAGAEQTTHANVDAIEVTDFIGTVRIETVSTGAVTLDTVAGDDANYPVRIEAKGGVLIIHSDEDPDDTRWWDKMNWRRNSENAFETFLEDYPTLTLVIPAGTALSFDSAVVKLNADNTSGAFSVREGHVDGVIGDIASGDIKIHGSGDLKVGAVAGDLNASIHGSGDLQVLTAARLDASIHGSGDIYIGDVGGDAETGIHGSGNFTLGNIGGPLIASIHGSGDIDANNVSGGAALSVHGSGNIELASVNGETTARIHGSGDIDIHDGRAENLNVQIFGSGGFEMSGLATNPDIQANSAGNVYISRHEGNVHVRGDGDVRISGVYYGEDD